MNWRFLFSLDDTVVGVSRVDGAGMDRIGEKVYMSRSLKSFFLKTSNNPKYLIQQPLLLCCCPIFSSVWFLSVLNPAPRALGRTSLLIPPLRSRLRLGIPPPHAALLRPCPWATAGHRFPVSLSLFLFRSYVRLCRVTGSTHKGRLMLLVVL